MEWTEYVRDFAVYGAAACCIIFGLTVLIDGAVDYLNTRYSAPRANPSAEPEASGRRKP